ncbi:AarF/ABC1/UbiB kinase family protein [Actinomadura rudentiformis]|uniref:AarF/ABC1/UbiB kinase family protein n=2 Tax=Actinomadura rudentiformis TaxID=359158 RepID=A0A6H9YET5_9ACTN|nr:AarF/ABC1/UbiB kinase family protein [Actinomadura rudentiformis]
MNPALWAAALASGVLLIAGLAWASRRLLGLPVGTARTAVGGLIGFSLPGFLAGGLQKDDPGLYFAASLGSAVLTAMTFIVVAEALVPTGSLPRPHELVVATRRRIARTRRYYQITRIAVRHGLGPYLRGRRGRGRGDGASLARSLRLALQEGGVTFVKFGQVLSTRRDLLPQAFIDELSHLQDKVPPAPAAEVERVLTEELGESPYTVFAEFDPVPLAAASIAQVHRARLRSGAEVVVKVQRPGIRPLVERDLDLVNRLAATLERRTRWGPSLGAVELAHGFGVALREELDFHVEARNTTAIGAGGPTGLRLPALHPERSTGRVLIQEWLDGVPLGAADRLIEERGLDRAKLARTLLDGLLTQIMRDGTFHADPHPGNILLMRDGGLALLDFGSVGRLDARMRGSLQDILIAVGRGDPAALSDALLEVVTRPEEIDEERLERALGQFMARHLSAGLAPGVDMFTELFRLMAAFRLAVHPEIAAVFRALATIEGTLTRLDPSFSIVAAAQDFAAAHFTERLAPGALKESLTGELLGMLPVLRRLPRRFDRITHSLEQGRLGVNVRLFADERDRHVVTGMLHQVLLTVLGATTAVVAAMLLGTAGGPQVTRDVGLFEVLGYGLLGVSSILVLRVLFTIFRADHRPAR